MEYGVVVNNKFALFDNEDEDPLEVLQRSQEQAAKKPAGKTVKDAKENSNAKVSAKNAKNTAKDTKPVAKQAAQPAKVLTPALEQKPKPPAQGQPPRRENATEKPPRFRQNENAPQRERRPPRDENRDQPRVDGDSRPERSEPRGDREEFHGRGGGFRRGGGRGGRGGRTEEGGFDRFGKREFDRHSGSDRTGLKPVEKREGGGAHNWGTIADAVAEQEQLAAKEVTEPATETEAPTNAGEEQAAEEVNEPEEKQMTLDEWKAMQDRNRVRAAFNIRKAGEGVSAQPEWKKMFVLKKKVEEHGEEEEEEEEEEEDDARAKHKTQVPIQIKFNDTGARGGFGRRGGRGGRGGGPGRRPEGGEEPRRGRSEKVDVVPNVDNELDFPSLA